MSIDFPLIHPLLAWNNPNNINALNLNSEPEEILEEDNIPENNEEDNGIGYDPAEYDSSLNRPFAFSIKPDIVRAGLISQNHYLDEDGIPYPSFLGVSYNPSITAGIATPNGFVGIGCDFSLHKDFIFADNSVYARCNIFASIDVNNNWWSDYNESDYRLIRQGVIPIPDDYVTRANPGLRIGFEVTERRISIDAYIVTGRRMKRPKWGGNLYYGFSDSITFGLRYYSASLASDPSSLRAFQGNNMMPNEDCFVFYFSIYSRNIFFNN
ncbi:hypothetical protein ACFL56_03910 [Candidatus Margulisiibacteriota bacterium]